MDGRTSGQWQSDGLGYDRSSTFGVEYQNPHETRDGTEKNNEVEDDHPLRAFVDGVDPELHDELDGPEANGSHYPDDGVHGDAAGGRVVYSPCQL